MRISSIASQDLLCVRPHAEVSSNGQVKQDWQLLPPLQEVSRSFHKTHPRLSLANNIFPDVMVHVYAEQVSAPIQMMERQIGVMEIVDMGVALQSVTKCSYIMSGVVTPADACRYKIVPRAHVPSKCFLVWSVCEQAATRRRKSR